MAVTHDGPGLSRGVVGIASTRSFEVVAIVDGPAGPTAPMGVIGTEIVAQFMRHDL